MTLTVPIGIVGLVLSVVPVWAADFSAELDFVTRASNANLFAIEESRLALDRTGDPKLKTFARHVVEDHGRAEAELLTAAGGSDGARRGASDAPDRVAGQVRRGL